MQSRSNTAELDYYIAVSNDLFHENDAHYL